MIHAVLCDRDGVLVDSERTNVDASLQALAQLGVTTDVYDAQIIMGKHPYDYVDTFVKKYGVSGKDFLDVRSTYYLHMIDMVEAQEDVCTVLREMRKLRLQIAIVTSASRENTERLLHRLGLKDLFDGMVTFDECAQRKPHPAPYRRAAHDLGVVSAECLVFEDSPVGLIAAKNAGMHCVIRRSALTRDVRFEDADLVVDDMRDAAVYIESLRK